MLSQCVINFKTTDLEADFIKGFLASRLKQELGVVDPSPRISDLSAQNKPETKRSKGSDKEKEKKTEKEKTKSTTKAGKDNFNSMNANTDNFAEQQAMMMRGRRRSTSRQKQPAHKASEFEEDEIVDLN